MNIKSLSIKNTKSFGEQVDMDFQNSLNILIGPNAGGKSNLMDILNVVLVLFFVYPWRIVSQVDDHTGRMTRQYLRRNKGTIFDPVGQFLEKNNKRLNEDQEIRITLEPEVGDVENIETIIKNSEKLAVFESDYLNSNLTKTFVDSLGNFCPDQLKDKRLQYTIRNHTLDSSNAEQKVFLDYLNNFELHSLLIGEYNNSVSNGERIQRLFPPLVYFSPYRVPSIRSLVMNLSGVDYSDLIDSYKKSHSKNISSTFEVAICYFATKFLYAGDDNEEFRQDEEVKLANKYLKELGYQGLMFKLANQPDSRKKNIYEAVLKKDSGESIEISRASSGEKEIFNLLLGISSFNIRNGIVIIDEPDLHLHPKWQDLLLELFFDLSIERGIQFFLVTHSPHFITQKSVKNVLRVYATDGESRVVPSPTLTESEKDLFLIINSFSSAKIFFADKIILVEGDVDNIIYSIILRKMQAEIQTDKTETIEIIDVHGKNNLERFREFLSKWSIVSYRIADKDYASQNKDNLFVLTGGSIENYFPQQVQRKHFKIDDGIVIARRIETNKIQIPRELKDIFEKIIIN